MSGEGFGPAEAGATHTRIIWSTAPEGTPQPEMYEQALTRTVSLLTSTGKHLILFVDWPELGFDPRSCLPRPVTLFSGPPPVCRSTRSGRFSQPRLPRSIVCTTKTICWIAAI